MLFVSNKLLEIFPHPFYYRETATLVHYSGAARGDDAMASITNLQILYRMYDAPKSIINLTVRVSLTSCVTIKLAKNAIYAQ